MTRKNRSIPACTVIPVLSYPDVHAAVEWLCRSFGFSERLRIGDHRSQLTYGDGALVVADAPSASSADFRHSVMIRVADVDQHYETAKGAGAVLVNPPTDYPFGERQYTVEDLWGHRWTFTQTIADVDPRDWGGVLFEEA